MTFTWRGLIYGGGHQPVKKENGPLTPPRNPPNMGTSGRKPNQNEKGNHMTKYAVFYTDMLGKRVTMSEKDGLVDIQFLPNFVLMNLKQEGMRTTMYIPAKDVHQIVAVHD